VIREVDRSGVDLERCVEIVNAVEPDNPVTVDFLREAADGDFLLHESGDGYAYVVRSSAAGNALAMVRVLPEARKRGIGSALVEAARERATALGRESIWGRVRDSDSLAFAKRRGFRELTREITVLRKLQPGDGEAAPGILPLRDEHLQQVYEVWAECLPEIHVPLVGEVPPYEEWLEQEARADGPVLVALDGDRVVGYARLCETGMSHRLEHGLTAVRLSHRRRGIGTALKQAQIKWAADNGYSELTSEMVEGNAPMRALNERLGYRQLPPVIVVGGSAR
jgi:GNAT superfamily N-acetyltransferase